MIKVNVFGDLNPLALLESYGLQPGQYEVEYYIFNPSEVESMCGLLLADSEEHEGDSSGVPQGLWVFPEDAPRWQCHMVNYYLSRRWDQVVVQEHCEGFWELGQFVPRTFEKLCNV